MRTLLIIGTAVEIILVLVVLVTYLVIITRTLRRINRSLGQVSFGVRAIESQTAPVGGSVLRVNGQLSQLASVFEDLAAAAAGTGGGGSGRRG